MYVTQQSTQTENKYLQIHHAHKLKTDDQIMKSVIVFITTVDRHK
jgi:hypothetical protein